MGQHVSTEDGFWVPARGGGSMNLRSSEQRTARETLIEQEKQRWAAWDSALACLHGASLLFANGDTADGQDELRKGIAALTALRAAPAPTGDYSKVEQDCRGCMGPCGRCHELDGAAPAPEPEHVCGGCGYKWNWPVPSPIELCGDCWRKTWPILRGAAPAPEGETWHPRATAPETGVAFRAYGHALVDLDFNPSGQVEACWDGDRFIGAVWNGQSDIWNTLPIEFTHWQPMPAAPASPGPTPEGRETNWLAGALAKAKATAANVLTPEQVQEMRVRHERTIRAAQAETLREVLAELSKGVDYRTGYEAAQHYSRTKLSAITGGTEEP
jgi:hypothetical protein